MPIPYELETLDSVEDEKYKALYKQDGDKFRLDLDQYAEFVKAPVVAKNKDFQKRLEKVKPIADRFSNVDEAKWQAFQEWEASRDESDDDDAGDDKGKPDALNVKKLIKAELKKAEEAFKAQLKAKEDEILTERSKFEQYRFKQDLTTAAIESGVIGTRLSKFMNAAIAEGIFGFHEGKLVVMDDGEPATESVSDRLTAMSNADDWKFFFEAREKGGGSGEQKQGGRKGDKPLKRSEMTDTEKSDFIKRNGGGAKGMKAFLALPV